MEKKRKVGHRCFPSLSRTLRRGGVNSSIAIVSSSFSPLFFAYAYQRVVGWKGQFPYKGRREGKSRFLPFLSSSSHPLPLLLPENKNICRQKHIFRKTRLFSFEDLCSTQVPQGTNTSYMFKIAIAIAVALLLLLRRHRAGHGDAIWSRHSVSE